MGTRAIRAAAEDPVSAAVVAMVGVVLGFPVATAVHYGVGNALVVVVTALAVLLALVVALGLGE